MPDALKAVSVTFCGTVNASDDPNLNQVKLYGVCLLVDITIESPHKYTKLAILASKGIRKFPAHKKKSFQHKRLPPVAFDLAISVLLV